MKSVVGRAWWCMPVMTVLIKPSQENSKFKARLVYTVRYYLKKKKCTGNYKVQNWHCFWHKINRIDLNLLAYSLFCGIITFVPHNFSKIRPSIRKHWGMTHLENRRVARMVDLTILCETSLKDFKCRQKEPHERPYGRPLGSRFKINRSWECWSRTIESQRWLWTQH